MMGGDDCESDDCGDMLCVCCVCCEMCVRWWWGVLGLFWIVVALGGVCV